MVLPFDKLRPDLARTLLPPCEQARVEAYLLDDCGHGTDVFGTRTEGLGSAYALGYWLHQNYFRVCSAGHEHVPDRGAAVVVGNHSGVLPFDGVMAAVDLFRFKDPPRLLRYMVDYFVYRVPFLGTYFRSLGQVSGTRRNFDGLIREGHLIGDVHLAPLATGEVRIRILVDRKSQTLVTENVVFATVNEFSSQLRSDDPTLTPDDPLDFNDTPANEPDSDDDGSPDGNESSTEDRDGDGIPDAQDYDPLGYFYCEETGNILTGGLIAVENVGTGGIQTGLGSSNDITVLQDGSAGFYQFYVTSPGTYRLIVTLPADGVASTSRLSSGTLDVTSLLPDNPGVIGSGEVGSTGVLADFSAGANPFYTEFEIEFGDPSVFNNNIPLMLCGEPSLLASKFVETEPELQDDGSSVLTYRLTAENDGTTQVNNVFLTDDLTTAFGAGNFTISSVSLDEAPVGFGGALDPFFDGNTNTNLLTTGGILAPGERVSVLLTVNVTADPNDYTNTLTVGGEHPLDDFGVKQIVVSRLE